MHKSVGSGRAASADLPATNQLGICTESSPRPNISIAELPLFVGWNVLLFGIAERPNFIALDSLAGEIAHCTIMELLAGRSKRGQQTLNGILGYSRHSNGGANGIAFHECGDYLNSLIGGQRVHFLSLCICFLGIFALFLFRVPFR